MYMAYPLAVPDEIVKVVEKWEEKEGSRVFSLITTGFPPSESEMSPHVAAGVLNELDGFTHVERLDVILDSSGGHSEFAYQMANYLREHCVSLRVFIHDWAKSAATLFSLAADEIHMSPKAQLGPLDVQMRNPRHPEEDGFVSALNDYKAMEYLKEYGFVMLDLYVRTLKSRFPRMRMLDIIAQATPFVSQMMAPLFSRIDPLDFGDSNRALEGSIYYGQRLMKRYGYKNWRQDKVEELLKKMTWDYPSHGAVIDYHEAKELGLNVKRMSDSRKRDMATILDSVKICIGFVSPHPSKKKTNRKAKED